MKRVVTTNSNCTIHKLFLPYCRWFLSVKHRKEHIYTVITFTVTQAASLGDSRKMLDHWTIELLQLFSKSLESSQGIYHGNQRPHPPNATETKK